MIEHIAEAISLLKQGQIAMAADTLADAVIGQGMEIKKSVCRNGPEELDPLIIYMGPTKLAFGALAEGFAGTDSVDDQVGQALRGIRTEALAGEPPVIIGLIHEIVCYEGNELSEPLLLGQPGVREGIMCTVVHPFEDDYRVATLTVCYHYGDGEVVFDDRGGATDTAFRPESSLHEVGGDTASAIIDFFKEVATI